MATDFEEEDFRLLTSRLLDRIMPVPIAVVCVSAAFLAGTGWPWIAGLSVGYIASNFCLSRLVVKAHGATQTWLVGNGRVLLTLSFMPLLTYFTGPGGPGWYVAVPAVAAMPMGFRPGKAWVPLALLTLGMAAARGLAGADVRQVLTAAVALGTMAAITTGLAAALRKVVERALRAERAQSDFLATMSHEIRTPMHGVLASLELVGNDNLSKEQQELMVAARSSASGLLAVINDVLDFSKIQAGKLSLEAVPFAPKQLLRQLQQEFTPRATEEGTPLSLVLSPELPEHLLGDPLRIAQIIRNYLSNALKFGRGSRVDVGVSGTLREGLYSFRVEVTDAGPGIPVEAQGRLFGRFEQVSRGTTRKYGGTGLGLAICRQLAELMSGTVGFSSPPERGSTFWLQLQLPIAQAPREANAKDAPRLAAHLEVLIVDDNAVNRMVGTRLLEVLGCRATAVEGGEQALELLETQSFDCILMDCQMPEMDGFEATRRIRALEGHKRVPIIAVTAGALQEDRIRCTEAGMDGFLPKPMSKAALASALSELTAPIPDGRSPVRSAKVG